MVDTKLLRDKPAAFSDDYRAAVQRVRVALIELLRSVGADPAKSRDLSRRLKLSKNLTWMVSKVVNADDVYSVAQHIPGPARIESLLAAVKRGQASQTAVDNLRSAFGEFNRMVETHTGDRATLELMASEMASDEVQTDQLLHCRKLAFKGNSGMLGVQTAVHMAAGIVAPNADDPTYADLVQVGGLFGFRRLRSSARWLLFRSSSWNDDGSMTGEQSSEPLFTTSHGVPLIEEFCSKPLPKLNILEQPGEVQYELPPGPVGNTAALTCVYAFMMRKTGPLYRDGQNQYMELGCNVVTPSETLIYDLMVHESLPWAFKPEAGVYSRVVAGPEHASTERERNRMVIAESTADVGFGATAMVTPQLPEHADLIRAVLDRAGWDPDAFRVIRFTMQYPPIPSTLLLYSQLPERNA